MRGLALASNSGWKTTTNNCLRHQSWHARHNHRSASAKLFADAEAEEREESNKHSKPSQADILLEKHENWDGEERIQDVVLRMLIDK
jgi:DnaJ family protein C protein 28